MPPHLLYSFYLRLRPLAAASLEASQGHHAHALTLALVGRSSPQLAQALHDAPGVKPFTVSPLLGRFLGRAPAPLTLIPEETYSVRITALTPEVFTAILDGALRQAAEPLRLAAAALELVQVLDVPGTAPLVRCQTFEEILDSAAPEESLHVEFMSPSTFRTREERNVLHPDPRLVVQSWLAKWNAFCPSPMPADLLQGDVLRPAYTRVRVRSLHMGNHPELGFCGFAGYAPAPALTAEKRRLLAALAEFSLYCGTGAKTTMGMGQSRRVTHDHPVPGGARSGPQEKR